MCYDRDCSKKYSERNGRNSKNTAVRLESGMDAVKRLQSEKEENERLTYKEIIKNEEINAYLRKRKRKPGTAGIYGSFAETLYAGCPSCRVRYTSCK